MSRKVVRKLNLKMCDSCGGHGLTCNCGTIKAPWFGNTFVNDGHQNFGPLHQYFVFGGVIANVTNPTPVVYSFAAITKNTISVSPATGYAVADLAQIGLISPATATVGQRASKFGDLFLLAGLTGINAIFNGEYRVLGVPNTSTGYFVLQSLDGTSGCLAPRVGDLFRIWFGGYNISMYQITAITSGVFSFISVITGAINPLRIVHVVSCQTSDRRLIY